MSWDVREAAAIFAGGALGAILRASVVDAWPTAPARWPWGTFAINVMGALALGYFVTRLQERLALSAYRRPLLGTGLCGALTTFSTMQIELLRMLDHDAIGLAVGYATASVLAGFGAVWLATNLVRRTRPTAPARPRWTRGRARR